jgi:hypothetical protein
MYSKPPPPTRSPPEPTPTDVHAGIEATLTDRGGTVMVDRRLEWSGCPVQISVIRRIARVPG